MEIQNRIEILIGSNAKEVLETDLGIANIEAVLNRVISPAEAAKLIVNSILND